MRRCLSFLFCLLLSSPASAINITMNFNSGASASPSYDANRAGRLSLLNYARAFYEDECQDTHNVTIDYLWRLL